MNIEDAIKSRRTFKLKADSDNPLPVIKGEAFKSEIERLIELAGQAPFHYQSTDTNRTENLRGAEPWRFHVLDGNTCRQLLESFKKDKPMKASDGIKQMLAAADALMLATWLPEKSRKLTRRFHPNVKNMEHIAATGAAIQNLLLAATSEGITNYWSSGGCLRKPKVLEFLGIPKKEILLGAVFLFPDEYPESVQTKMHGFFNVFGGAMLGYAHDLSTAELEEIISEEDAEQFSFTDENFCWKDYSISTEEVAELRKTALLSYGSCSFEEPIEDLQKLGLF